MSIIDHPVRTGPSATTPTDVTWTAERAGLWVARRGDDFVGMVEAHWGEGFAATTRLAKALGTFATVEEAQRSLEEEPAT
jgi:hypothetical protein